MERDAIVLETRDDVLGFDPVEGRLVSFRSKGAPDQEFIASAPAHPVFTIQYLDGEREYQQIDSRSATEHEIRLEEGTSGKTLTMRFRRVGGVAVDVTATVGASSSEPLSRWGISVRNGAGIRIADVQFPFVVCRYRLGGKPGSETVVLPHGFGNLVKEPTYEKLGPDFPGAWQLCWQNGSFSHYPGGQFAQFLAYYNDRSGLYLATEDARAHVKRFRCLHRDPGIRVGVAHVGDWPAQGERRLPYDTVLGSFHGDWYDAAGMYRDWSLRQSWGTPLSRRTDVPQWLLESPPHITIRPQAVVDAGPVYPIEEFLPYEKCIPLLEGVSRGADSPVVAVIMAWERAGSWVYPDCFPPVGGEESVTAFARACRQRGWHVGSFCNGTRWVTGHSWNGYDGRAYYKEHHGERSVSREANGSVWREHWDVGWRPSIVQCMGTALTRETAARFVERLLGWGLESIQFFDQNCGAATFPCLAEDNEHPPMPGRWMAEKMEATVAEFRRLAREAGEKEVTNSVEMCCNEYCLPLFQQADARVRPPGHKVPYGDVVPIYQFLYHECIVLHGMMSPGPEPYHVEIANAANGVLGEIAGGVLTGDGSLLDKDTYNWAEWEPRVGSARAGLAMIRAVTAMRRGAGRDFLVYGRMLKPARVGGVLTRRWAYEGKRHEIPALFHAAWQAPDGRFGLALANWTRETQKARVADARLGTAVVEHAIAKAARQRRRRVERGKLEVAVPPLAMVLLEARAR
jgi:hypothetical protein